MPWQPDEFKRKHFKAATSSQSKKASSIANAILRGGGSEGTAIATGISRAKGQGLQSKINSQRKPK